MCRHLCPDGCPAAKTFGSQTGRRRRRHASGAGTTWRSLLLALCGESRGSRKSMSPFYSQFLDDAIFVPKKENCLDSYVPCLSFRGWLNDVTWLGCDF